MWSDSPWELKAFLKVRDNQEEPLDFSAEFSFLDRPPADFDLNRSLDLSDEADLAAFLAAFEEDEVMGFMVVLGSAIKAAPPGTAVRTNFSMDSAQT